MVAGLVWVPFGLLGLRRRRPGAGAHRPGDGSGAWCSPSACSPASPSSPAPRWPSLAGVPTRIDDPADPRLADYVGLTDVALRRRTEPERGLYIAESEKVIRRALAAGHRPAVLPHGASAGSPTSPTSSSGPRRTASPSSSASRTSSRRSPGSTCTAGRSRRCSGRCCRPWREVLDGARRVLVLEDVVDHTNVGAVFRSAAALGVDAVLVTPRCADPLYRRSIRVSMGTVFQVPWTRIDPWPGGVAQLRELGFTDGGAGPRGRLGRARRAGGGPAGAARPRARHRGRRAVAAHVAAVDLTVRIPMAGGRRLAQRRRGRRRRRVGPAGAGLSAVRIVVSGTHASGKSTLVSDLATALRVRAAARPLRARRRRREPAGAARSWRSSTWRPSGWSSSPAAADVVAERGPVDLLAYLEALAELGRPAVGPDLDGPAAGDGGRGDGPRRPARRRCRSTRVTASRCRTTRTPSCARRWTGTCSTCATTRTWSAGAARWSRWPARRRTRLAQVLAAVADGSTAV